MDEPDLVLVPALVGLPAAQAHEMAISARVVAVDPDPDTPPTVSGTVTAQQPLAGSLFEILGLGQQCPVDGVALGSATDDGRVHSSPVGDRSPERDPVPVVSVRVQQEIQAPRAVVESGEAEGRDDVAATCPTCGKPAHRLLPVPAPLLHPLLRGYETLTGPAALATWDEAELLAVTMCTPRGTADAEALGVHPRALASVLRG